jgi:catechol 2,3-dioxygenase-like lactoylglutathione lyase family enzyme
MAPEVRHLHLSSRDRAASQGFYERYFGFRFDAVFPRGDEPAATILRSPGGFQLFLECGSTGKLPPWFHFGFFVESVDACRDLYERMQHDHVTIVHPFVTEPFAYYFFADPDGHVIQVYFDPKAR